jgi:hypothetical protein
MFEAARLGIDEHCPVVPPIGGDLRADGARGDRRRDEHHRGEHNTGLGSGGDVRNAQHHVHGVRLRGQREAISQRYSSSTSLVIAAATTNAIRTQPVGWIACRGGSVLRVGRWRLAARDAPLSVGIARRVQRTGDRSDADQRLDFLERARESVALDLEVVASLEVQPESFAGPEVPREA